MVAYSTKQQRSEEKGRGLGELLALTAILILVLALAGCAGTLDKAVNTCFALEGAPSYTRAEGVEKFSCERNASSTATVRAAR